MIIPIIGTELRLLKIVESYKLLKWLEIKNRASK